MEEIDPATPEAFEPAADPSEEIERLSGSFKRLLDRIDEERRRSGQLVVRAQEEERGRIARDLHDEVNQALTAILLRLEALAQDAPPYLAEQVGELKGLVNQAMDELLQLDALEREIRQADGPAYLERVPLEDVERLLGPEAREDLERLRELARRLEEAGYLEREGDELTLTARAIRNLGLPPSYWALVAREIDTIGVRSVVVALTAALFTGMVLALQSAVNMARFGAENYVGPVVALSMLRELGPVLTALLVGGKVASGITAELGSMRVTEQIDALRALGVNDIKRLVVPRLMAAVIVFPLVTTLADGVGLLGGMLVVVFERDVDPYLYWNTIAYWVVMKDFLTGLAKSVVFGFLVTLIGCYNGLVTVGGTEGLGRATTATVVQVAMGVIISDFFLTKLLLFLFW